MRLALRLHLISHGLWKAGAVGRPVAKLVHWTSKALTNCDIDPRAVIDASVDLPHATGVVIGERAVVGARTRIMPGVVIGSRNWDHADRHATIGDDVLIGAGAVVLGAIHIADGARVGANSVVLEDVPAGAVVVGVPARAVAQEPSQP